MVWFAQLDGLLLGIQSPVWKLPIDYDFQLKATQQHQWFFTNSDSKAMKPVGTTGDAIRVSCNALFVHKIKMHMMGFIEHETHCICPDYHVYTACKSSVTFVMDWTIVCYVSIVFVLVSFELSSLMNSYLVIDMM